MDLIRKRKEEDQYYLIFDLIIYFNYSFNYFVTLKYDPERTINFMVKNKQYQIIIKSSLAKSSNYKDLNKKTISNFSQEIPS
jgi:hypothetical protein